MKLIFFLIFSLGLSTEACNSSANKIQKEHICTELFSDSAQTEAFKILGAAAHSSLWWHSVEFPLHITARFLNGTEFQKNKVRQYAKQWAEVSAPGFDGKKKIRISFYPYDGSSSGNVTDLRIIFTPGGSSSYVGSDAERIPQDQPTMFFGWINETEPEESIRQVVLHEFGHALGLIHEHQSPIANIPWDREKVYEYYRITQSPPWEPSKVDFNIFRRYDAGGTNYTAYDTNSIMHYYIPNSLTIGDFSTPWNSKLSSIDSEFIKKIYRYEPCIVNETCCFDRRGKRILCP